MCRLPQDQETNEASERKHDDHNCEAKVNHLPQTPFMHGAELDLQNGLSIFLVDWDDTLFPTSALTACGPEALGPAFEVIDDLIIQLLEAVLILPHSQVILLTNANIQWVYHAAKEFLPKFSKWLEAPPSNMSVTSAHKPRDKSVDPQSAAHTAEVAQRKNRVVQQMSVSLQELISELKAHMVQVMSIGDTPVDLEAAHVLASALVAEERYVKTVFMKPKPSVAELVWQHRTLLGTLGGMAQMGRSFHQLMYWAQVPPILNLRTPSQQVSSAPARTPKNVASLEASTISGIDRSVDAKAQVVSSPTSTRGSRRRRNCQWKKSQA
jgi:hypothetical protein